MRKGPGSTFQGVTGSDDHYTVRPPLPVLADFDPLSPTYLADPFAVLRSLPHETDVVQAPSIDYCVVRRYAYIEAAFLNAETYSAVPTQRPLVPLQPETMKCGGHSEGDTGCKKALLLEVGAVGRRHAVSYRPETARPVIATAPGPPDTGRRSRSRMESA